MLDTNTYLLRKQFGEFANRKLRDRLIFTRWMHYKGGQYIITNIVWNAEVDEWAIVYVPVDGPARDQSFVRTMANWFETTERFQPRFTEV